MQKQNQPVIQALAAKPSIVSKYAECDAMLFEGKNVACMLGESMALMAIGKYKNANNNPLIQIVKKSLFSHLQRVPVEPNSPHVRQFDATIQMLI